MGLYQGGWTTFLAAVDVLMAKRRSKDLTMEGEEKVDGVSW